MKIDEETLIKIIKEAKELSKHLQTFKLLSMICKDIIDAAVTIVTTTLLPHCQMNQICLPTKGISKPKQHH